MSACLEVFRIPYFESSYVSGPIQETSGKSVAVVTQARDRYDDRVVSVFGNVSGMMVLCRNLGLEPQSAIESVVISRVWVDVQQTYMKSDLKVFFF